MLGVKTDNNCYWFFLIKLKIFLKKKLLFYQKLTTVKK